MPNSVAPSLHAKCDKPSGLGFNFMKGKKNLPTIGTKFGRWVIVEHLGSDNKYRSIAKVKCECGNTRTVRVSELTYGASTSCGCFNKEQVSKRAKTHGLSKTPLYLVWVGMKDRCLNKNNTHYQHYGGRGITIHKYWVNDFCSFLYWCIKNGWKKGLQIDRIDNNEGYYPNNCRIVTPAVNSRNKRNNILITYNGQTKVLIDWCNILGLKHNTISTRYHKGCSVEDLFKQSNRKTK